MITLNEKAKAPITKAQLNKLIEANIELILLLMSKKTNLLLASFFVNPVINILIAYRMAKLVSLQSKKSKSKCDENKFVFMLNDDVLSYVNMCIDNMGKKKKFISNAGKHTAKHIKTRCESHINQ